MFCVERKMVKLLKSVNLICVNLIESLHHVINSAFQFYCCCGAE